MSLPRPALASLASLASSALSLASLVSLLSLAACGGKIEPCVDGVCEPEPPPSPSGVAAPTSTPPSRSSAPPVEPDCAPPYMVEAADGRCVWSCGEGTRPGPGAQCVCAEGTIEAGVDAFGRRICR
jgi:hypothetical protein